ncbi:hypothetical protein [Thalassospira mesophila]|uniref:Uncharacterized protein n=1 Tax=Thalassospira mesophila TaxID=1293891 RepID=A0A1Y2L2C6_9PROT|nr:hypothetical protein [Thalassospira mesophila]OSQ39626.1 hypothetical protein TMES_06445 [Thalassospira mesophila]
MIPIRKDFIFSATCHECGRALTSNVAVIALDDEGNELAFGPTCIRKVLDNAAEQKLKDIPDFTKAIKLTPISGKEKNSTLSEKSHLARADKLLKQKALTYLILRQEKVPGVSYEVLAEYLKKYKSGQDLTDGEIRHILNIERKFAGSRLGEKNLMTVYAYLRCIDQALPYIHEDKRNFLESIKKQLLTKYYLTSTQVEKTGEWISRVPGEIVLSGDGFFRN